MTGHSHVRHILVAVLLRYGTANFSRLTAREIYREWFTGKRMTIKVWTSIYTQQGERGNSNVWKKHSSVGKMARVPVLEKYDLKNVGNSTQAISRLAISVFVIL